MIQRKFRIECPVRFQSRARPTYGKRHYPPLPQETDIKKQNALVPIPGIALYLAAHHGLSFSEHLLGGLFRVYLFFGLRNLYLGLGIVDAIDAEHILFRPLYQVEYLRVLRHRFKEQTELQLPGFRNIAFLAQGQPHSPLHGITRILFIAQVRGRYELKPRVDFPFRRAIHDRGRIGQHHLVYGHHPRIGIEGLQTGVDHFTFSQ